MTDWGPELYGDRWAEIYDAWTAARWNPAGELDFLADLARGGRALELGVGTGRVAIPLAERGVRVVGVDVSERMLARLREKGGSVEAVLGTMEAPPVEGPFDLVYCVFTTFFGLQSQEEQVRCFAAVADLLAPDGAFVLQAFVPDTTRFDHGQRVAAVEVEPEAVGLAATRHDPLTQTVLEQKVVVAGDGSLRLFPTRIRYAWPAELDLMARLAGLRLRDRFEDFERRPFTAASGFHVSVYGR